MDIDVRIITTDYEIGFDFCKRYRFPPRRPVLVGGDAIFACTNLAGGDESNEHADTMDLVITFDEDASVDEFVTWFYDILKKRPAKIRSLVIAGVETPVDETQIKRAFEEGIKKTEA